jgi:hypothetical protein
MPDTLYHISINVREMLAKCDDVLCDMYRCDPEHLPEIRARLVIAMARGHVWTPLYGQCDNFDPAKGCRGHNVNQADFPQPDMPCKENRSPPLSY